MVAEVEDDVAELFCVEKKVEVDLVFENFSLVLGGGIVEAQAWFFYLVLGLNYWGLIVCL